VIEALHAPAATAALIAAAASLCLVPTAMWVAGWSGFVAIPRAGPTRKIPYLGGPAVALAILAGSQLVDGASLHVAIALLLATVLGVVGLVDDHLSLSPALRLVMQAVAAGIFVAVTGPLPLTGTTAVDATLTVVWLVTVLNGVNFLDNSDALAAIVVALAAVGFAFIAGAQTPVGVCAAAIAGACGAFFAFNVRPAAVYLGDAGSLFLGFLLPALALELVHTSDRPTHSALTVITVLALPVIEMFITTTRRIVHGRRCWSSAPDNLSYALAQRRFGMTGALVVHIGAQALLAVVAVLVFEERLPASAAIVVVALELVGFAVATRGATVHGENVRWTRRARWAAFIGLAGVVVVGAAGTFASIHAYRAATAGASTLEIAARKLHAGDTAEARAAFVDAEKQLARADNLLGPIATVTRVIPGVGQNVNAVRIAIDSGRDLAHDGEQFAGSVNLHAIRLRHADVPIPAVRNAQRPLAALAQSVEHAHQRVAAIDDQMLLAPIARKVNAIRSLLDTAAIDTANAADLARVTPAILGANGPRRYLVVVQNPAEARATGGIPASFGVLDARDGALELGDLRPVEELNGAAQALRATAAPADSEYLRRYGRFEPHLWWENIAMSPDFPTVASVMVGQYERQTEQRIDGVISIDPSALAAILRLSGPIHVASWPTAITADNVADVVLRDEYVRFRDTNQRKAFLGQVTKEAWNALRETDLGDPVRLAHTLAPAAQERHLLIWLAEAQEHRVLDSLALDGGVPDGTGDALFATVQNAAATKLDLYMSRRLRYDLTVDPVAADRANVRGNVSLSIANDAPDELPTFVATPATGHNEVGDLHSFVSIYSALELDRVSVDGAPGALATEREFGRWVYSTFVSVARGAQSRLDLDVHGSTMLTSNTYRLQLLPQPGPNAEVVDAVIRVPDGARIVDARGCTLITAQECRRTGRLVRPEIVEIDIRG
jgi:UDP-N-acetylmuramyl pentapeptide phosphotransferase/UDP-N-acetylglucosamine-1-phosphate transferase